MKVLICSDGSRQAENAVRFGRLIASACQAEVTLFGIVEHPATEEDLFHALRREQSMLKEKHLQVEFITRSGEPVAEILKQTRQVAYDLVVIGAVRKGTKGAYWMSAKAYKLLKGLEVPVLVMIGHREQIGRMMICASGSSQANQAIQYAGQLARAVQAKVTLVHVFAQPPALYTDFINRLQDVNAVLNSHSMLGRNLLAQKQILEDLGVPTEVKLRRGSAVWELLGEIHQGGYDLVVTGFSLKGGPFQSYLLGDVTRELLNRAECPLLIVRASKPAKSVAAGWIDRFRKIFTEAPSEPAVSSPAKPDKPEPGDKN